MKKIIVILAIAISTSAIAAFAVLFNVTLTDIVLILDDATLRQTMTDSILPTDNAYQNNQNAADSLLPTDNAYQNNQNAADSLLPTDNVYQNNQNAADSLLPTDSVQPSNEANDVLALTAVAGRNFLVLPADNLALTDQTSSQVEIPEVPETVQEDEQRERGGPNEVVFDKSHFENHPLDRMQIISFYLLNSQGNAIQQLRLGDSADISATVRNTQGISQAYVFIVLIVDENNYAVQIIMASSTINGGDSADIRQSWTPMGRGDYSLKIMIWDNISSSPSALSEVAIKTIKVYG